MQLLMSNKATQKKMFVAHTKKYCSTFLIGISYVI